MSNLKSKWWTFYKVDCSDESSEPNLKSNGGPFIRLIVVKKVDESSEPNLKSNGGPFIRADCSKELTYGSHGKRNRRFGWTSITSPGERGRPVPFISRGEGRGPSWISSSTCIYNVLALSSVDNFFLPNFSMCEPFCDLMHLWTGYLLCETDLCTIEGYTNLCGVNESCFLVPNLHLT